MTVLSLFACLNSLNQTKFFIILAVLRQSVQRVGGVHLLVIASEGNAAPFEEMLQWWRALATLRLI